jgi:hypothetical protein
MIWRLSPPNHILKKAIFPAFASQKQEKWPSLKNFIELCKKSQNCLDGLCRQ